MNLKDCPILLYSINYFVIDVLFKAENLVNDNSTQICKEYFIFQIFLYLLF